MTGLRIIAGKHKGRPIEAGKHAAVRPTSGFARQAVFNILAHGDYAEALAGTVADIFCGTGAFGLEALSRGAAHAAFVDESTHALAAARDNAERFGETSRATFLRAQLPQLPPAPAPFALLFLDPPYFSNLILPTLTRLREQGWADAHSLLIAEHDAREEVTLPPEFSEIDTRRYGRALVRLLQLNG